MLRSYGLILLAIVVVWLVARLSMTSTPPFETTPGQPSERSLAVMERFDVNGQRQWVFLRGHDRDRPLLLVLHGGPGTAMAAHVRTLVPELEEDFLVAHWEQRGAGKSYAATAFDATFTVEQLVADTIAITRALLARFDRERLFVLAGSWGTFLGINAIHQRPDLYQGYFGVGQIVDQGRGERLSYDWALQQARSRGDTEAVEVLESIGPPPYEDHVKQLLVQRRVLRRYGGAIRHPERRRAIDDPWILLRQEEYGVLDKINWFRGQLKSERLLGPAFRRVDLRQRIRSVEVPVYFFQGTHDWQTPTVLVEEYVEALRAPHKQLFLFESSAHLPIFEEPAAFVSTLRSVVARDFAARPAA